MDQKIIETLDYYEFYVYVRTLPAHTVFCSIGIGMKSEKALQSSTDLTFSMLLER